MLTRILLAALLIAGTASTPAHADDGPQLPGEVLAASRYCQLMMPPSKTPD